VKHVQEVSRRLWERGEKNAVVTGSTDAKERTRAVEAFRSGAYRHILNVNVFTEGFNVKQVDAVVLLRPTLSKGLYSQMVGRGLRLHPDKQDCIILDYARCIETHGPIDCLEDEKVRTVACKNCREVFARPLGKCPHCGWIIPKQEMERMVAEERERARHEARAAQLAILGALPQRLEVDDVAVSVHRKEGSPESLCVTYRSGMRTVREWLCFGHGGYAERKARQWWADRFGSKEAETISVQGAVTNLFTGQMIKGVTKSVTVLKRGKFYEVVGHELLVGDQVVQIGTQGE
jgi:DNA repair protein RadD